VTYDRESAWKRDAQGRETVTIYVPEGYKDADEFLRDCQLERVDC